MPLHDKKAFLLRKEVGSAKGPNGEVFILSHVMGHMPAVEDVKTGNTYVFDWSGIITLAIERGVSNVAEGTSTTDPGDSGAKRADDAAPDAG